MSLTDLFTLTGAVALTVIAKYTPSLVEAWRFRRYVRNTGLADLLADIDALTGNGRNGIIETLKDNSPV